VEQDEKECIYTAIVYAKALKRNIRLVHVTYKKDNGNDIQKLYFCTDTAEEARSILESSRSRFQIEFLYRDGKQHTGLNDCQARSENKLHFHFNASLTAINVAKVQHWLKRPKKERGAFSMADIKTINHNKLLLDRFINLFGRNPYAAKNRKLIDQLIFYGTMTA
ncbi:MAG: transposase, partial [Bacteroidales bacterium]